MAVPGVVNITVTAETGPGLSTTEAVFNNIRELNFDFLQQVMTIVDANGAEFQFAYSTFATFTWVIASGVSTLTVST